MAEKTWFRGQKNTGVSNERLFRDRYKVLGCPRKLGSMVRITGL